MNVTATNEHKKKLKGKKNRETSSSLYSNQSKGHENSTTLI